MALSFHVDYWDYIGWKDPFASAAATERQRDYGRALGLRMVYTPQMVVDGRYDVVGSQRSEVESSIETAAAQPKLPIAIAESGGKLRITAPAMERSRDSASVQCQ